MYVRHGHNIPVVLLRSFIAISGHGSFTKAAEELNLTQPAISAQIKRLQRLVGGDLFFKKAQGVGLTELGTMVESYAQRILALNDQIFAIAGQAPAHETVRLGIQNIFAGHVLGDVVHEVPHDGHYRFICGSAPFLAEKLKGGYVDLVFMLAQTESRRNVLAEWIEPIVWGRAPDVFPVVENEPIPLVGREEGFIDRQVMRVLDELDAPYKIVFNAGDLSALAAAVEAGIGVMVAPKRALPPSLTVARERILPKLPELRSAVFHKEGFDVKRHRTLVDAFITAVSPHDTTAKKLVQRA
ncbi:MAG TPA: LysR family transcriptional regulator [Xanthobacteraceae bacterium]|jgi:DNA-binding transcriptional LysR family regulator|nr:LysR family transcriptional regulator [Xanthobacteraceae bacterium]